MASCLDCFFGGAIGREKMLLKKPSTSVILNCETVVINTTTKDTSLPFTVVSNTNHGHVHDL